MEHVSPQLCLKKSTTTETNGPTTWSWRVTSSFSTQAMAHLLVWKNVSDFNDIRQAPLHARHFDILDEFIAEVFLLLPAFMAFMLFLGRALAEVFITDFFMAP